MCAFIYTLSKNIFSTSLIFCQSAITIPQGCLHFILNFSWAWGYSTHTQRPLILVYKYVNTYPLKCFFSRPLEISLALRLNWFIVFSSSLSKQSIFVFNRNGNVFPCSWTSTEKSICSVFSITTLLTQFLDA